jgi:hypothetical protein
VELRPLSIGEIFDRAITLYLKNFAPFVGIMLVLMVPLALFRYFFDRTQTGSIDRAISILTHPGTIPRSPADPLGVWSPQAIAAIFGIAIVFYLLLPFALNAVAVGVARLYRGRPVEFRPCYAAALRRWWPTIGVLVLDVFVLVGWYFGFALVTIVGVVAAAALFAAVKVLGILVGIVVFCLALALLLAIFPILIVLGFAMYAVVIEGQGSGAAIAAAFGRIFTRTEVWRALLFSLAAGAIWMAGSTIVSIVSFLALYFHQVAIAASIETILDAAILPFATVVVAVYYYDVRIRHEGYDLESELEGLSAGPPAVA